MSGAPIMKEGRFLSKTMLAFAARQPCIAADHSQCDGPITVHHFPVKGMGGARRRDDKVAPLCVRHHDLAQRYRIPHETQERWVHEIRSRFLETCTPVEFAAFVDDWKKWSEGRVFAWVPA